MHTDNAQEDLHVLPPDNPFVPPKGDICFINKLPPELLSRIFEIGAADNGSEEDEDDTAQHWDDFTRHLLPKDAHASDAEKELDDEDGKDKNEDGDETDDESDSNATGSTDDAELPWPAFEIVVSHVCRHWRNVAFSTPSLWTTIEVDYDARPPYELVSTLLERSKGLPIDIYIDCDSPDGECPGGHDPYCGSLSDNDFKFLCSLLIPHIHRWRTLEVDVSQYPLMYVLLTALSDPSISSAPQLATLELYSHEDMEEFNSFKYPSMSKHLTLFGGSAPCLKSVVLWGVHVDWNQPWIASASKLTDLELSYLAEVVRPSWGQFASMLRSATALEKLSLRMSGPWGDPPYWFIEPTPGSSGELNAPIQLLKVTDFVLAFQSPPRAVGLLRKLYLPALKTLELDFDDGDYTDFVHELDGPATSVSSTPVQEQSCSLLSRLESLKIAGLPCQNECLAILYGRLQNLTALNISLTHLPQSYLEILGTNCTPAGDMWLPRLATLFVTEISGNLIRSVVQRRREAGVPLEALFVEQSCEMDDADAEWLKKNLKTFEFFEGSDDESVEFEDLDEDDDDLDDDEDEDYLDEDLHHLYEDDEDMDDDMDDWEDTYH